MPIIEEFVQVLGFDIDDRDLTEFSGEVAAATGRIAALTAGAFGAVAAISSMLSAASETAGASRFARSIDVAYDALQRLEFAAADVGTPIGSIRSALNGLRGAARGAATGLDEGAIASFQHLGINIRAANGEIKTADRLLLDIADSVTNATNQNLAFTLAERLGLGTDLNLLLRLGSDGIRALGHEAERLGLILDDDAARSSEQFAKKLDRLRTSVQSLLVRVGVPLVDWVTSLIDRFQAFQKTGAGQAVVAGLEVSVAALVATLGLALEPLKAFVALWDEFPEIALLATPALWAILSPIIAATAPILATTAALAGLLAALNEIRVFLQGGDSLIGKGLEFFGLNQDFVRANLRDFASHGIEGLGLIGSSVGSFASGLIPNSPPAPLPAGGSGGAPPSSSVLNQQVDVHVNGADNPSLVGDRVKRAISGLARESVAQQQSPLSR